MTQQEITLQYRKAIDIYNSRKKTKTKGHNNDKSCRTHNLALIKEIAVSSGLHEGKLMRIVELK